VIALPLIGFWNCPPRQCIDRTIGMHGVRRPYAVCRPTEARPGKRTLLGRGMALVLSIVWLIAVICLIVHARRQRDAWPALPSYQPGTESQPSVAVIIPARNESANIKRCLTSIVAQKYPRLTICVVDDDSSDGTAEIAEAFGQTCSSEGSRLGFSSPRWSG
jgi:hypothetical protein